MEWTKQFGRYIIVMLLQVLLFDQLQLWGACHPYIYVLCLLMMPITLTHSLSMIIGAVAGLVMDIFCNSLGVHMAACILIMFIRPYLIGAIVNDKDRLNEQISLRSIGMEALIKYVVILVLVHHLTVFSLAAWSWSHMGFVLLETLISSIVTILIIIGYNAMSYR
ncbi:MAG: rod shape-determining protein MreD [Paludibacteraceae bacterium]|nr:rod shape-determining protein MreD [Paludibacteraceae bacterium]